MPLPKVQLLVCTNERAAGAAKPSCGPRGGAELYRRFKDRIREAGLRDEVIVTRTGCLKHCSHGVVVGVWPHNLWYAGVGLDDVDEILESTVRDGRLYIDPAEGRRWLEYIREDPRVRVRFDGKVYSARAVLVEDPAELEGLPEDRIVYRLEGTAAAP